MIGKRARSFATATVGAAVLTGALLSAGPVVAATQYPGGGTWNWGNTLGRNYSDYLVNRDHSSAVSCGDKTDRALAGKNRWSNAALWKVSGCGFFYNIL
jgi:lactococcin 972 family bacteriocin